MGGTVIKKFLASIFFYLGFIWLEGYCPGIESNTSCRLELLKAIS